ncbi:MAG: hypothetical protein L7S62_04150 [Flavobacteriales bacterium]|nr:hypothetical protein [Flavobacteriales bacterium]
MNATKERVSGQWLYRIIVSAHKSSVNVKTRKVAFTHQSTGQHANTRVLRTNEEQRQVA